MLAYIKNFGVWNKDKKCKFKEKVTSERARNHKKFKTKKLGFLMSGGGIYIVSTKQFRKYFILQFFR